MPKQSWQDVLRMPISEFTQMSLRDQRKAISQVASAANKRLQRLRKSGIENSLTYRIEQSGGKFSVRGKDTVDLLSERNRLLDFMTNRFSSAGEWRKLIRDLRKNPAYEGMTDQQISQAFSAYDIAREIDSEVVNKLNRYEVQRETARIKARNPDITPQDLTKRINEWTQQQLAQIRNEYESTSTRFADAIEYDIPTRAQSKRNRKHKR